MEPISPTIQAVLDLFATTLAAVRFADLDAKVLTSLAAEVQSAGEQVAAAQAALTTARDALQERQDALHQQAVRAIAYARVYAENDEPLAHRIDAIGLARPQRRPRTTDETLAMAPDPQAPRPRGRPRKIPPPQEEPMLAGVMPSAE
jgi:hypothetical protein